MGFRESEGGVEVIGGLGVILSTSLRPFRET